jgi:hypothetical protein
MEYIGETYDFKQAYKNSDGFIEIFSNTFEKNQKMPVKRLVTRFKTINEYNAFIVLKRQERVKKLAEAKNKKYDPYKDPKQIRIE